MPSIDVEIIGMVVGAALTLLVFGYLLGDNPLYRLTLHLFIGALVGYSFGIVVHEVLIKIALGSLANNPILVVPLVMGICLAVFKIARRLAYIGNFFLAYLIGVGVAVASAGALLGTLVPQIEATGSALRFDLADPLRLVRGLVIVGGTVCALLAFDFTLSAGKRRGLAGILGQAVGFSGKVGRWMLVFAFGVAFAGALTASLSIFIGRIQYLIIAGSKIAEFFGF